MIKISERDNLTEYFYDKLNESASLDDMWGEFVRSLNSRISQNFDEYVDAEFKKSDIVTRKRRVNDEWDYRKNDNSLTPEKEQELSDRLAQLDDEEDAFKYSIREDLMNVHTKLWKKYLSERI